MIKDLYTLEEIREKIASQNYNAEILLQHAMLHIQGLEHRYEDLDEAYEELYKSHESLEEKLWSIT